MKTARRQHGLTLIELMIAMVIGLLIMIGMGGLFVQTKQSFRQDENIAHMQEDARFAMAELAGDIAMTGFWGPLVEGSLIDGDPGLPGSITDATAATLFDTQSPAIGGDAISTAGAFDWSDALDDFQADSDAISVRRVEGVTTDPADLEATRFYLQTNGALGVLLEGDDAPSGSVPAPFEYWEYVPAIYYVRTFCRPGDGIPSLVRRYVKAGTVTTDCIARGIESMQIEYGIDVNGDGHPNRYIDGLASATAPQVASVRVHLLARAGRIDPSYENTKTYTIANYTLDKSGVGASDRYYRRVYTTTIQTRNPTATRLID